MFQILFLAEHFNTNEEVWLEIIKDKRIQDYSVEFEYYSGIYRDKEKLLDEFHKAVKDIFNNINLDTEKLSLENETNLLISSTIFGDITSNINSNQDIHDENIELDMPNRASLDPSISREKLEPLIIQFTLML